jgi:hypothetical protein
MAYKCPGGGTKHKGIMQDRARCSENQRYVRLDHEAIVREGHFHTRNTHRDGDGGGKNREP